MSRLDKFITGFFIGLEAALFIGGIVTGIKSGRNIIGYDILGIQFIAAVLYFAYFEIKYRRSK